MNRAILFSALVSCSVFAKEISPGADLRAEFNALQPGGELVLTGGTYTLPDGRFGVTASGTERAPIVIRAKDGEHVHLVRPDAKQNLIDLDAVAWLELRGIEFSGGSAGIRIGKAQHLTIADCEVHSTGDVAIRANDPGETYESLQLLRNHLHHTDGTGEGMYLGCNTDGCRVSNSLIAGNWIHHTNGPLVTQGDGIEVKEGSSGNVIRDNVIHDTRYPCIITYSAAGHGPANVIERNLLWNCGDHGIQAASDAVIRNNIILSAAIDGIAMRQHQSTLPENLVVVNNTVLHAGVDAVSLRNPTGPVVIANNALYGQGGLALKFIGDPSRLTFSGNVGEGRVDVATLMPGSLAADLVNASSTGGLPSDPFPRSGGALLGAGDAAHLPQDDFNGTPRNGVADVGAYAFAQSNSGWVLSDGFKPLTTPATPDAGVPDGGQTPDAAPGASAEPEGGCGCSSVGAVPLLAALLPLLRRKARD